MVLSVMTGWLVGYPSIETVAIISLGANFFWGIVFGIIYARLYDSIPSKGIWKGLIYGIMIYLFSNIYLVSYGIAYGDPFVINWNIGAIGGIYVFITFGVIVGILYKKES